MNKIIYEESNEVSEVSEEEMEKIAAGWGFGVCLVVGMACTTKDYQGVGIELGLCYTFGIA